MKVLVIGDSCDDIYVYGESQRLCPDAPVPILVSTEQKKTKGMAANVVANLEALGIECDFATQQETITKTRYVDKKTNHMFVRVDEEPSVKRINIETVKELLKENQYEAIVISDYDKGFLAESDIVSIACLVENEYKTECTFLDTKKKLGSWSTYVDFIKINKIEYEASKDFICQNKELMLDKLIITMDNEGAMYKEKIFPVKDVPIKDKSGAGDTFLAGLVYGYIHKFIPWSMCVIPQLSDAAIEIANEAATLVVQQKGVCVVNQEQLFNILLLRGLR